MKVSLMAVVLAAVVLSATGCHRRADYLQPKTDNKVLADVIRGATVLFPLSMAGNILVSEIIRDTERCDKNGCQKDNCCAKKAPCCE